MECSCLDDTSVKIVMDTAIGLALEYHLKKNQLVKNTSLVSKTSTQTNKSSSLFNTLLMGSLKKDTSTSNMPSNLNSSTHNSKEYSFFSLKRNKSIHSEKGGRDYKSCDEEAPVKPLAKSQSVKLERKNATKPKETATPDSLVNGELQSTRDQLISNQKRKSKHSIKSERQLGLRCLSCTRGQNETSSSLNKI